MIDKNNNTDEVNLADVIDIIWNGKLKIIFCVILSCLIGSTFLFLQEKKFVSKIYLSLLNTPPFEKSSFLKKKIEEIFHSQDTFKTWKYENPSRQLEYYTIEKVISLNGKLFYKNKNSHVTSFIFDKTGSFLEIKSNDLVIINEIYNYITYVNSILHKEYLELALNEEKNLKTMISSMNYSNEITKYILGIERFIKRAKDGDKIYKIEYPTIPKNINDNSFLISISSFLLGVFLGMVFVIIQHEYKKNRKIS